MKSTDQYRLAISDNGKVVGGITLNGGRGRASSSRCGCSRQKDLLSNKRTIP